MDKQTLFDIETSFLANEAVVLEGPPGIGKTAFMEAFAKEHNCHIEILVASLIDTTDVTGIMFPDKQTHCAEYYVAPFVKRILAAAFAGKRTILFIDELTTGTELIQSLCLRIFNDRQVGDQALPEDCWTVAAQNPVDWAVNGCTIAPPVANRLTHYDIHFDAEDFITQFPGYFGRPPILPGIDPIHWETSRTYVAGFLKHMSHWTLKLPEAESERSKAWPSPRTWTKASKYLSVRHTDYSLATGAVAGCVGFKAAADFFTWYRNLDLIPPEKVFADPKGWKVNTSRPDIIYVIIGNCFQYLKNNKTTKNWLTFWTIMEYVAENGFADIPLIWYRDMVAMKKEFKEFVAMPAAAVKRFEPLMNSAGIKTR